MKLPSLLIQDIRNWRRENKHLFFVLFFYIPLHYHWNSQMRYLRSLEGQFSTIQTLNPLWLWHPAEPSVRGLERIEKRWGWSHITGRHQTYCLTLGTILWGRHYCYHLKEEGVQVERASVVYSRSCSSKQWNPTSDPSMVGLSQCTYY